MAMATKQYNRTNDPGVLYQASFKIAYDLWLLPQNIQQPVHPQSELQLMQPSETAECTVLPVSLVGLQRSYVFFTRRVTLDDVELNLLHLFLCSNL